MEILSHKNTIKQTINAKNSKNGTAPRSQSKVTGWQ